MVILELEELTGGYDTTQVFHEINLSVHEGECVCLFGPNGHGKSTLMNTVAGLLDPWHGSITFDGIRLNQLGDRKSRRSHYLNYDLFRRRRIDPARVARAGLILVAQESALFPEMRAMEALAIATVAAKHSTRKAKIQSPYQIFPQLEKRATSKIRFLSGGERQMLAMSCGLLAAPRLLILDEPTLGLSPKMRGEIAAAIHMIKAVGISIILVEQNLSFAKPLGDRFLLFDHGRISKHFDRGTIPDDATLLALMFQGSN